MSEEQIAAKRPARPSAFLEASATRTQHIVDELIEERCPKLRDHGAWPVLRPALYQLLGYRRARHMADRVVTMTGRQSFDYLAQELAVQLAIEGMDHLPRSGRVIVASNHPTGLADGIAVWDLIKRKREDIVFFANADAIRVNPDFEDVIIPVEWVMAKRTPAKTRETLKRAGEAFADEKCVVLFPSGRLAQRVDGELRERDWFSTVIGLARKQNASIVPLNVSARNSWIYYLFCDLNPELRDITLFHELLNKKHSRFRMRFGAPITPDQLDGDANALTEKLRDHVAYKLRDDAGAVF
jgi:putative hemolysin